MVHGGLRAGVLPELVGELAEWRHVAPMLTARGPMTQGGRGEPHRWNGGKRGGWMRLGDDETKRRRTELGATANGVRRRGECEVRRVAAVLGVPFIVLERGGGSRSEELDGGRGLRFEVCHFKE
jgi:hypothetical protein